MHPIRLTAALAGSLALAGLLAASSASADRFGLQRKYAVEITNLSKQVLTPPVVASHRSSFRVFSVGGTADTPLYTLAETGANGPLADALDDRHEVLDVATGAGPILPGQSATITIRGNHRFPSFSVFGMLASTNDAFFAVQGKRLTSWKTGADAPAYDAGSEANNESCDYLPGPPCSGSTARMTDGAEGFIHRSNGIHGVDDLVPSDADWRGPVARIEVYRLD